MDADSSPYIIPNNSLQSPFPHSLLRTRQMKSPHVRVHGLEGGGSWRIGSGVQDFKV